MKKYKIPILNGSYIEFHLLPAEEADRFNVTLKYNNPYFEEHIFNYVTGNKYNIDELDAGVVPLVVYIALTLSGVLNSKEEFLDIIDNSRNALLNNAYYVLYTKIAQYQKYTLDELKQKTLNELIELYSFSELIAGQHFIDTKKERESMQKEKDGTPLKKKGIGAFTSSEIDALKAAIQSAELADI